MTPFKLIYTIVMGIIFAVSFDNITKSRFSFIERIILSSGIVLGTVITIFTVDVLFFPFIITTFFLVDKIRNKRTNLKSGLNSVLVLLNFFICDVIANIINTILFDNKSRESIFGYTFYLILTSVFAITFSKIIQFTIQKDISRDKTKSYSYYFVLGNVIFSLLIVSLSFITNKVLNVTDVRIYLINLLLFLAYISSSIFMSYIFNKYTLNEMELSIREEEVERMEEYSKTIEELYENMRKFKHDYKNILLSLYEFIEEKKYDDLEKYYKENILETESYVNSSDYTIKLKNIKITPIKALIASKLIRATNNKINVFVDVSDEILRIPINYIDAIRILGNLLDNAIEGALETEEKCLNFGVVYKGSSIVFIIENSCRQDIHPIYKLLEKGFSTKGNNRGMGLSSVKQIVNEDENLTLNIEVNNGIFRIELWMRVT